MENPLLEVAKPCLFPAVTSHPTEGTVHRGEGDSSNTPNNPTPDEAHIPCQEVRKVMCPETAATLQGRLCTVDI